ncbi:hypothetical protein [Arthrobacter sp. HLT1-20]
MTPTTTQQLGPRPVDPGPAQSSIGFHAIARKVVVRAAGIEIHGYVEAKLGSRVRVVWAVASGRHRHGMFSAATVFPPSRDRHWAGYPISAERLGGFDKAAG